MVDLAAVILAAGQGTRMRSKTPKVLHLVAGRPMALHVAQVTAAVGIAQPVLVIGHHAERIREALGERFHYALQAEQLGTAHALMQGLAEVPAGARSVLVLCGDTPLLTVETVRALVDLRERENAAATVLTARVPDPAGYGRIVRDLDDNVQAIIEEKAATPELRAIDEINAGVYCFRADLLARYLPGLRSHPHGDHAEFYLTDMVEALVAGGHTVRAYVTPDPGEAEGVNDRVQLAAAEAVLRQRIRERVMRQGVTLLDPASTFIDDQVVIGADTVIHPFTIIEGDTTIGADCRVGPGTTIRRSRIGDNCTIRNSDLEDVVVEDGVDIGPYSHLRNGAHLAGGVHVGNFAEIKHSFVGRGSKMGHFSYLGDARVGERVNVSAGVITCNYDGKEKHPTFIENDVFIGCDTMLVAPVTLGEQSHTGAGAVVTHDVPAHTLVVGVPARVTRRLPSAAEEEENQS